MKASITDINTTDDKKKIILIFNRWVAIQQYSIIESYQFEHYRLNF